MIIAIIVHFKLKRVKSNSDSMQEHYKVYALFDKTVSESKKYKAKPKSKCFKTKEEALEERNHLYQQGTHKQHSFKIMMLWKIK